MTRHQTVLDRFRDHVRRQPESDLYVFVDDKGRDTERFNHAQFAGRTDRLAAHLTAELGLAAGDRVLLVYPPSAEFVTAFVACLTAGLVPVPVAPPNPFKLGADLNAFESIAADSASVAVLSEKSYLRARKLGAARDLFVRRRGAWSELPWHRTDASSLGPGRGDPGAPAGVPGPGEPAFLQYTSGSTSSPKGVMISHANILHQLEINSSDLGLGPASRSVAWVPHFHDFCLVSGILTALYGNGVLYLMSPITFLRRPRLWFEVMSRIRATHTAAPDFAFRLAVRKTTAEQRLSWDLSSLEVVMSAAEPIRASTVDAFLDDFAEAGLAPEAFCPAYGLAEHTVGVSVFGRRRLRVDRALLELQRKVKVASEDSGGESGGESRHDRELLTLFGCGPPSDEVDVRIVEPDSRRELPAGQVGEIWVDSPSKALGYHGRPELTARVFEARLAGDGRGGRSYLRTGDLGFVWGGEVFVTGRLKDLIILRGRNIYPQDLEESAFSAHPAIRPGRAVAFAAPDPGAAGGGERERIVVMMEIGAKKASSQLLDEVVLATRSRVQRDHEISCDVLLVAPPGEILKTTSGKVRRQACRQAYLDGALDRRLLRHDVKHSRPVRQGASSEKLPV